MINNNQKAFTLIELMLYIGIASFMLLVTFLFVSQILESRVKAQTIAEVEQQGDWAVQVIGQTIRNSASPINFPTAGTSTSSLSLKMSNGELNPTNIILASGVIFIDEASVGAVPLTNSNIVVSNLLFRNVANTGTKGSIKFSFNVAYKNASTRSEFNYTKTFYGTATIRY